MKRRRMRRRVFNVFAFACLAFAIYLIKFTKDEPTQHQTRTAHAVTDAKTASVKTTH